MERSAESNEDALNLPRLLSWAQFNMLNNTVIEP